MHWLLLGRITSATCVFGKVLLCRSGPSVTSRFAAQLLLRSALVVSFCIWVSASVFDEASSGLLVLGALLEFMSIEFLMKYLRRRRQHGLEGDLREGPGAVASLLSRPSRLVASAAIAALLVPMGMSAAAQVVDIETDTTTGVGVTGVFVGSAEIPADIFGTYSGSNVFYSFERFSMGQGSAITLTPGATGASAENVIARVTGSTPSEIDGVLATSGFNENNFIFVNPNGVVFGPSGSVSTSGSFHVSTADNVVFENGEVFSATFPGSSVLSSARPDAFGFLGPAAGSIEVRTRLTVSDGRTLTLAGGDLLLDAAALEAPGGTIRLLAVQSEGQIDNVFDADAPVELSSFERLGQISVRNGSTVTASGLEPMGQADAVNLRTVSLFCGAGCLARVLVVSEVNSELGDVELATDGNLFVVLRPTPLPSGGTILVRGEDMLIEDSDLRSRSFGPDSGDIDVRLRGDLTIAKVEETIFETGISARAETLVQPFENPLGGGQTFVFIPGNSTGWMGAGGLVLAPEAGAFVRGENAAGGNIYIKAANLDMSGGARIATTTFASGNAGDIDLDVTGLLSLSGIDEFGPTTSTGKTSTSLFANAQGSSSGEGGTIRVRSGRVHLDNGGGIIAQTTGDGRAGDIDVLADQIYIGFDSQIDSSTSGQSFGGTSRIATGEGGSVSVSALELIELEGEVRDSFFGHISTGSKPQSAGGAGTVRIQSPRLVIRDGPGVSTVTQGEGTGGQIVLDVGELLMENGQILAESQAEAPVPANGAPAPGDAGSIVIGPENGVYPNTLVRLTGGSEISTRAEAAGGGNILINASLVSVFRDGNSVLELVKPSDGLARNIELTDSSISTSVRTGVGSGGNIAIDPSALVLNSSSVTAQADAGAGGDIFIATDFVISSSDSLIDASAGPAGIDGEIVIQGTSLLVANQSAKKSANYLRADALMKERCSSRSLGEGIGRLTLESRHDAKAPLDGYLFAWPSESENTLSPARDTVGCNRAS